MKRSPLTLEEHSLDKAVLGPQAHIDDTPFDALYAAPLGEGTQISGIGGGIELKRI
jgi:hypothetical protein